MQICNITAKPLWELLDVDDLEAGSAKEIVRENDEIHFARFSPPMGQASPPGLSLLTTRPRAWVSASSPAPA